MNNGVFNELESKWEGINILFYFKMTPSKQNNSKNKNNNNKISSK